MLPGFFKRFVYAQLSPQLLTVRDPVARTTISEIPEVAIRKTPGKHACMAAVGSAARAAAAEPHTEVHNPFAHPRSLISDFTVAEALLKAFVMRLQQNALLRFKPVLVLHPLGEHAGGLTQVELRALHELGFGAGASRVRLWQGPPLGDEEVVHEQFPLTGRLFR